MAPFHTWQIVKVRSVPRQWEPPARERLCLRTAADLFHEIAIAPIQQFVIHPAVGPMTDRHHAQRRSCADRGASAKADQMFLDSDVGGEDEQGLQVMNVHLNECSLMAIWPGDDDIIRVAFAEVVPFLT